MTMRRVLGLATAGVVLAGAMGGCEPSGGAGEPAGGGEPSPSACVEHYVEGLEANGEPLADEPPDDPYELLLYDRLTYRISGEDFMRYAVQRYTEPDKIPEQYRFPEQPELEGTDPLTFVFLEAMWEMDCLPPGAADKLLEDVGFGSPLSGEGTAP